MESRSVDTSDARWSDLAADLDALADAQDAAESDAMVAELTRAEHATIDLADRLRAATGAPVVLDLPDGEPVRGAVREVAEAWLVLDGVTRAPERHLVPLAAIDGVSGLESGSAPAARRELGITTLLRDLQRDRRTVLVRTRGNVYRGRVARVGADHLDLDTLDGNRGRRRVVPFSALLCVSHAPPGMAS
ncbi:hypothetical protein IHE71_16925 [Myceligenerans sp. TRM 65318]|uniref:Uncharacterized protein n=1 Tax=Myceligenerans pegani TaxID=2776917 RepID=A0ABR9N2N8_9MICO|nr:hypothetical protein [Myceligenerans sp. TRM 65318]MBE3019644.1 hypothetical protein [Myceligenerans sp. TRM 65318]